MIINMKNINCIYIGKNNVFINYGQTGKASKKLSGAWVFYPDGEPNTAYDVFVDRLYFPKH